MRGENVELVVGARHAVRQGKVVAALLGVAGRSLWQERRGKTPAAALVLPGPEVTAEIAAPSAALVRDYARAVGAAPDSYRRPPTVPAHLFPQWTFPVAARALRGLPYSMARLLNAGCRLEVNAPIPAGAPLTVRAQLLDVQANERRALLHERVITDAPDAPQAVVVDLYAVAPIAARGADGRTNTGGAAPRVKKGAGEGGSPSVPHGARELARLHVGRRAGLAYACLTGDFNPVHWVTTYARAAGFAGPILHGFALLARTIEALGRALFAGATERIRVIDVKFKRPLVLGNDVDVGLYLDGRHGDEIPDPAPAPGRPGRFGGLPARSAIRAHTATTQWRLASSGTSSMRRASRAGP
jgi:acyl dehydratase